MTELLDTAQSLGSLSAVLVYKSFFKFQIVTTALSDPKL